MGKLMFFSILAYGHQNVGLMISNYLLDKYGDEHQIYMLVDDVWKKRLQPQFPRFTYVVYENPLNESQNQKGDENPQDSLVSLILQANSNKDKTPIETIPEMVDIITQYLDCFPLMEDQISQIISEIQPDLIITDQICPLPFIINSRVPWALLISTNPIMFGLDELPPSMSGLGMKDKHKWSEFRQEYQKQTRACLDKLNEWYIRRGCRQVRFPYNMYESPYFNIYCFPKEIDYFEPGKIELPGKWFRLDSIVSPTNKYVKLNLPQDFLQKPGKIIYFSMGSLFSAHYELIQKFLDIFKDLPYKFIISKGIFGDRLIMPSNCWGEPFVQQKTVLKIVDLILSHGGNNTLNECFYFGVPMIVMPFSFDQHDNATRIQETGYGIKLNPFNCTRQEVIDSIEKMLDNEVIYRKWKQASARIQKHDGFNDLIKEILTYLN